MPITLVYCEDLAETINSNILEPVGILKMKQNKLYIQGCFIMIVLLNEAMDFMSNNCLGLCKLGHQYLHTLQQGD